MMKRRVSYLGANEEETSINLTSLIDVVFLVLIMFILVAPLVELDKVELATGPNHPSKELSSISKTDGITIHVHKDNTIWINTKQVEKSELLSVLRSLRQIYPEEPPQLFHDKDASFGTYQIIKNAAEEAGFSQLDIILNPN
jgi:biopolymer transport protein ExbD